MVGGLLSAHLLSYRLYLNQETNELDVRGKLDPEWPCNGPLLRLAVDVANKLLPGNANQCLLQDRCAPIYNIFLN